MSPTYGSFKWSCFGIVFIMAFHYKFRTSKGILAWPNTYPKVVGTLNINYTKLPLFDLFT